MYPTFPSFRRQPPDAPQRRFNTLPLSSLGLRIHCTFVSPFREPGLGDTVWASPLGSRLATTSGRNAFVILRTDDSLPVTPHPASRRRGYLQLQAGERMPGGDFHTPDRVHSQAYCHCFQAVPLGALRGLTAQDQWPTISAARPPGKTVGVSIDVPMKSNTSSGSRTSLESATILLASRAVGFGQIERVKLPSGPFMTNKHRDRRSIPINRMIP